MPSILTTLTIKLQIEVVLHNRLKSFFVNAVTSKNFQHFVKKIVNFCDFIPGNSRNLTALFQSANKTISLFNHFN